jgi:hypothetical protein
MTYVIMSATTWARELRRHGITDVSSRCPGFSISAVTRRGVIARAATIERALAARDADTTLATLPRSGTSWRPRLLANLRSGMVLALVGMGAAVFAAFCVGRPQEGVKL